MKGWPGPTVGLLTVAWLFTVVALAARWLDGDADDVRLAAVLVGGPLVLAVVAFAGRLRGVATGYVVLAVLGAVLVFYGRVVA